MQINLKAKPRYDKSTKMLDVIEETLTRRI